MGALIHHLGTPAMNPSGFKALCATLATFMAQTMSAEAIHESIKVSIGPSRNKTGWTQYHDRLDRYLMAVTTTAPGTTQGHPVQKRMKAAWERHTSHPTQASQAVEAPAAKVGHPVSKPTEKRPFGWNLNFAGRTGQSAREYLSRWGAFETWIVEVYAKEGVSGSAYNAGDWWFMTIKNGKVQGPEKGQYITACGWNKANSVSELDPRWPDNEKCEVLQVKGYGPPNCPIWQIQ